MVGDSYIYIYTIMADVHLLFRLWLSLNMMSSLLSRPTAILQQSVAVWTSLPVKGCPGLHGLLLLSLFVVDIINELHVRTISTISSFSVHHNPGEVLCCRVSSWPGTHPLSEHCL